MIDLKYLRGWLTSGSAIALCLAAPAAFAQSGPAEDTGETITIVGTTIEETLPQELEKYGSELEVVDSETLRNNVYIDAQQALQMQVPGLFVGTRGGAFSYMDISLQGSRTQDMLLLVDGVRINNRLYATTMSDTLPASMIERIEVLKGGQGLFYGTQSAAGVVNMVTRGYTDEFNGLVNVAADSNDGRHIDGFIRGQLGPGNYVLFASHDKGDGFETYDAFAPSTTDRNRSYDVLNYGAKYRFELGDRVAIDARYQHTDAGVDNTAPRLIAYSINERDEDIASLGVDIKAADWAQILVKGYWHDWDSTYTTIRNQMANAGAGPGIAGQVTTDLNTYWGFEDKGINALAKLTPGGPFEYLVGYDYQTYSGKDDVLLIAEQEEEVHAPFVQVRSTDAFVENLALAVGARYTETGGASNTVWNASARYDVSDAFYVQGNVGTGFLLPTAENLYAIETFEIGNPNLAPEESSNANIGVGGAFAAGPNISWQATYFARDIDNLIGFVDCDPAVPARDCATLFPQFTDPAFFDGNGFFENVPGTVKVRGFELSAAADFNNGFTATASYTDAETKDPSGSQRPRVPRSLAKFGAAYDADAWGASLSAAWTGELNSASLPGGIGVVGYGDYVVVDLAGHLFLDAEQKHKLTARVENLLDEDYRTSVGRSAPVANFDTSPAFVFGFRGAPQTLRVSYTYAF